MKSSIEVAWNSLCRSCLFSLWSMACRMEVGTRMLACLDASAVFGIHIHDPGQVSLYSSSAESSRRAEVVGHKYYDMRVEVKNQGLRSLVAEPLEPSKCQLSDLILSRKMCVRFLPGHSFLDFASSLKRLILLLLARKRLVQTFDDVVEILWL